MWQQFNAVGIYDGLLAVVRTLRSDHDRLRREFWLALARHFRGRKRAVNLRQVLR